MDYSERVNSKQGGGGVADFQEANVHRKQRVKDLLSTSILNLDNDPYVFRNHVGLLECRLCLTTHNNESSYLAHIGGKKHQLNLEKRRMLEEKDTKNANVINKNVVSINNAPKRSWKKIGKPSYKVSKIRDTKTFKMGLLINVMYPQAKEEPLFRFQTYYELSQKNQNVVASYLDRNKLELGQEQFQYLVISCEPYENICILIPNKEIDNDEMNDNYWWYWDKDIKEFYLQFLYK